MKNMRRRIYPLFFLFPLFIGIVLFKLYPIYYSLVLSFSDIQFRPGGIISEYRGLDNWNRIFLDPLMSHIITVTLKFVVLSVIGTIMFGLGAALLLNQEFRGKKIVIVSCLLPWAIPNIMTAQIWLWMLNGEYGVINNVFTKLGLLPNFIPFLNEPQWAFFWVVVLEIWIGFPLTFLTFLSGLQLIPTHLYEVALIDGAGKIRRFWNITLPLLKPVFLFVLVQRIIWNFKAFASIYLLTEGGPFNATLVYYYYIWKQTFGYYEFGYGSALAYLFTIFLLFLSILYVRLMVRGER